MVDKKEEYKEKENIKELVELSYRKGRGLEELAREKSTREINENQDDAEMLKSVAEWQLSISFLQLLLWEKAATLKLGEVVIKDTVDYLPTAYKKLQNRITNKKVKTILDTGICDYVVIR